MKAPAVVAEAAHEAGLGVGVDVGQEQVEIAVGVVVGPCALSVHGWIDGRGGVREQPTAAARTVVPHQHRPPGGGVGVEHRRDQEVRVAVVVRVGPGEGAQVIGPGVGRVLPVVRQRAVELGQQPRVVAVDDRLTVGGDGEIVIAVGVEVGPREVGGSGRQRSERQLLVGEQPAATRIGTFVDEEHEPVLGAHVVDDVEPDGRKVEVTVAVDVGRRHGVDPEVLLGRRDEERVGGRGHLEEGGLRGRRRGDAEQDRERDRSAARSPHSRRTPRAEIVGCSEILATAR